MDFYWESITDVLTSEIQDNSVVNEAKSKKDDDYVYHPVPSTTKTAASCWCLDTRSKETSPYSLRRRVVVDFSNIREELNPSRGTNGRDGKHCMRIPFLPVVIRSEDIYATTTNDLSPSNSPTIRQDIELAEDSCMCETGEDDCMPMLIAASTADETMISSSSSSSSSDDSSISSTPMNVENDENQLSSYSNSFSHNNECYVSTMALGTDYSSIGLFDFEPTESSDSSSNGSFDVALVEYNTTSVGCHPRLTTAICLYGTGQDDDVKDFRFADDSVEKTNQYEPAALPFQLPQPRSERRCLRRLIVLVLTLLGLFLAGAPIVQHEAQQLFPPHMTQLSELRSHLQGRHPSHMRSFGLTYLDWKFGCPAAPTTTRLFARRFNDLTRTTILHTLHWAESSSGYTVGSQETKEILQRLVVLPEGRDNRIIDNNVWTGFLTFLLDPRNGSMLLSASKDLHHKSEH